MKQHLIDFLREAKIDAVVAAEEQHGGFYSFGLKLSPKVKISKIEGLVREIGLALNMSAPSLREHNGLLYLDFRAKTHPVVAFDQLDQASGFSANNYFLDRYRLPVLVGTVRGQQPVILDLASMPHLFISGTTNSGKSICCHALIQSLAMQAEANDLELILIDPKRVEFSRYEDYRCLSSDVIYDTEEALDILESLSEQMDERLEKFRKAKCRDIFEYRSKGREMELTVVVIDELADILRVSRKKFKVVLERLAAKGRAAGIHLIACTQYPHSDVVPSTIIANFSGRICFALQSAAQSRVVLGAGGAENLFGRGDGLLTANDYHMQRFQGVYIDLSRKDSELIESSLGANLVKAFCKLF